MSWHLGEQGPPFLGLQSFQPEHADIFFGREIEIQEARFALGEQARRGCAFLLLTGASGSGKSSLARAGVLPEIVEHEQDDQVRGWRSLIITPAELSPHPVLSLVNRLIKPDLLPELETQAASVAEDLRVNPQQAITQSIRPLLDGLAERAGGRIRFLVVIDQLEEIFASHVMTAQERADFLNVVEALARSGAFWVLATARSDFYHKIQEEPVLARLLEGRGPLPVLAPESDALQRLIQEPARLAGLRFETQENGVSLADQILRDASTHAEMLPLVEFALRELFDQRTDEGMLVKSVYDRLGGVEGAIGKKAEETFQGLPPKTQAAFEELLPLLVAIQADTKGSFTRRWANMAELRATPERSQMTDVLIASRFFSADQQGNTPGASFSHEALLHCWPRITQWISANRQFLQMRGRVEQQQQRWEQQGGDTSLLLPRGLPLEEGRTLLTAARHILSGELAEFIYASIQYANVQEARAQRRRRAVMAVMGTLTLVAMSGGILAWLEQRQAVSAGKQADLKSHEAQEALKQSKRQLAFNHFQNGVSQFGAGRVTRACNDLFLAQHITDHNDPIQAVSRRLQIDYLEFGGSSPSLIMHHQNRVTCSAFSKDGSRIVTGSADRTARLWDGSTGAPLGKPMRHDGEVTAVAFSPDGQKILTASRDNIARLWDAQTGVALGPLMQHEGQITCVAFSPDGLKILTGSQDKTARLWNAQTGVPLGPSLQHQASIECACFSPDGTRILTGSADQTARLWDAQTGAPMGAVMQHEGRVDCAVFNPDGTRVATCSTDDKAILWDAQTGAPVGQPLQHDESSVSKVIFSPDGKRVLTASLDDTARIWDAQTGKQIGEPIRQEGLWSVAYSPDGTRLVTITLDKTAQLWDMETRSVLGEPLRHGRDIVDVAFSPDGLRILTISEDNTARLWEPSSGIQLGTLTEVENEVRQALFSPDGEQIAICTYNDKTLQLWNGHTGTPISIPIEHQEPIRHVAFSPDGTRIATASQDKTVRLWDQKSGAPLGQAMHHNEWVNCVGFSPDGTRLATGSNDRTARLWSGHTGAPLGQAMVHDLPVDTLAFSPDGSRLATGTHDKQSASTSGIAALWDGHSGSPLGQPMLHNTGVSKLAFSPDGTRLLTGTLYGMKGSAIGATAQLWNGMTGAPWGEPMIHESHIRSLAFSPDGSRIVTGSADTARLWDSKTTAAIGEPMWHGLPVASVAFSPDGTSILTASMDQTARLWEAYSAAPLGQIFSHDDSLSCASFSPDGTRIVTGSYKNASRLWSLEKRPLPQDLNQFLAYQTGLRFDRETSSARTLDAESLEECWKQLSTDTGWLKEFANYLSRRAIATRRELLARARGVRYWFGVEFHLARLPESERSSPEILHTQTSVAAEQEHWDEALKANSRLWAGSPNSLQAGIERWHLLVAMNHLQEAKQLQQMLISRIIAGGTSFEIDSLCTNVSVKPDSTEAAQLLTQAQKVASHGNKSPWTQRTLGMAFYRTEQYNESLRALNRSIELQNTHQPDVLTLAFLALVHQKISQLPEAVEYRSRAEAEIRRQLALPPRDKDYPDWRERLEFQWLREEMSSEGIVISDPAEAVMPDESPDRD